MPSLSQLPDKLKRNKLTRALTHLGFEISTKGGKGSHFKAAYIFNQKSITILFDLRKDVLYYVLKEIEIQTGITWYQIKNYL